MSHMSFQINLEDTEGMETVLDFISSYLNTCRVAECKARRQAELRRENDAYDETVEEDPEEPCDTVTTDVEVDSAGEPWDPKKHSARKTKLQDGTWRPRRGTKSTEEKPVPPPPPADAAMAPEEIGYKAMMDTLKGKGLTLPQMNALAQQLGESSIGLLINKPELIPAVLALAEKGVTA